jgi:hypothetical protein
MSDTVVGTRESKMDLAETIEAGETRGTGEAR